MTAFSASKDVVYVSEMESAEYEKACRLESKPGGSNM